MSFIPFIRDYIELLNTVYNSLSNDINLQKIIYETIIYLAGTIKFVLIYILTFQWLQDLIYLPILIPKLSNSILKETFFLETSLKNIFNILEIPTYNNNKFFIGFCNSFFLALPISCAHLIYVRRLLIQGDIAGIAAGFGNIFGQLFFIGSILYGFRFLIIPWFFFEPLTYIFGIGLMLTIIYDIVHERIIKIINWNNKIAILKIFCLNFLLIWTEQSCIFQFLGNLTFDADSSILETFHTTTFFSFFSIHFSYLLGLFFGCIFFNSIFAFFLKSITEFFQIQFAILRSTWLIKVNFCLLTLTIAFTFSSIPFYGLDYLVTQPLGFISEDKSFKNTIFSPNEIRDPFGILSLFSENLSLDTDVTSFDKGFYLKSPNFQTFEDLNYSGEYASTIRQGKSQLFDEYKQKAKKIREILIKTPETEKEFDLRSEDPDQKRSNTSNSSNLNSISISERNSFDLDFPKYYPIDDNVYSFSKIKKRFDKNYKNPSNITFANILQDSLNNVFFDEEFTSSDVELDKRLKQKYYANPMYKFLLSNDIDNFLHRQPKEYSLSPKEEVDLYEKRLILERYNDTLKAYNTLSYVEVFQNFFNGSKSFSDRVYNQQFKGTLHIVRRLFSISLNSTDKKTEELILKYDQSLFNSLKNNKIFFENEIYHEELKKDLHLSKSDKLNNYKRPNWEDVEPVTKSPKLELVSQSPLYFGWDEDLRKTVITNRLLSKSLTNFTQPKLNFSKITGFPGESQNGFQNIEFTTWPISKNQKKNKEFNLSLNLRLLFETKNSVKFLNYNQLIPLFEYQNLHRTHIFSYDTLPNNILKLVSNDIEIIPPNRGGFIWPGTANLNFSIKDIFPVLKS